MGNPFLDPRDRLNGLYQIIDKRGQKVKFTLNWAQKDLYENQWFCNIILKARQLGISTYVCLLFLDRCLFNSNQSAGIIAHTVEDAQHMFRRVKFAYDSLPDVFKAKVSCDNDTAQMLKFSNGSSLRVGTSLRSSTTQFLHISEFGKICAKYPDKAQEIITGSLNTVTEGQYIFIESTAEGREGYFYDMCKLAQSRKNQNLTKLDFKFHFYPWWKDPTYKTGSSLSINEELVDYFHHLKGIGIDIDEEQKNWYASKFAIQQDNMRREYPSTPEESWEQSNLGTYYGKIMTDARIENRVGFVPWEESIPVYTAWDLGYNDSTAIWYFQIYGKEIRLIDYSEGGDSLEYWLGEVKKKPYVYEKHFAPHDIMVHEYTSGMTRQSAARKMGMHLIAVKKLDVIRGIDQCRLLIRKCWFDEKKCELGIKALENYRKEWDDRHGTWKSNPLHNFASHGADAFRTLALGISTIIGQQEYDSSKESVRRSTYIQNRFNTNFG